MPKLTIRLPGLPPVTHALGGAVITVGRTPENDIQIADPSVSKHHAKLELTNGEYVVHDLGSTNGTFVNNQRVRNALVHHSDLLKFANIETTFEVAALDDDVVPNPVTQTPSALGAASTPVNVTSTAYTPAAKSAAAKPAAAKPAAANPAVAKPAAAFAPRADAGTRHSAPRKGLPGWVLPAAGVAVAVLIGGGVYWWMNRAPGGTPAPGGSQPKTETNAAPVTDAARLMAEENARAAEAAALANRPISVSDVPSIGALLRDEKPEVRRNAARALHALGKDGLAALPALRDAVKDSDPDTRLWAGLALAKLDPEDHTAVPVLIEALKSENIQVRQVAVQLFALHRFSGDEATPVLELLRKMAESDENEEVRKSAASTVKLLAPTAKVANP